MAERCKTSCRLQQIILIIEIKWIKSVGTHVVCRLKDAWKAEDWEEMLASPIGSIWFAAAAEGQRQPEQK